MRRDQLAEAILSLVAPSDRAASAVGDLMEEAAARGGVWFWRSLARLTLWLLGRDLLVAPVRMVIASAIAWFLYMGLSVAVALAGYVIVTIVWAIGYVFANHTGLELLTDVLRIRFDWPPIPMWAAFAIQAVVFFAVAPYQIGRGSAACCRGHELSLLVIMAPVWLTMAAFVPVVGVGIAVRPVMMPVIMTFVLLGALSQRFQFSRG